MHKRNLSIDYLKILTMTLVTSIHFICNNNFCDNLDMSSYNRFFCDTLITLSYSFVNLFVLMSGYLLATKTFQKRITGTWSLVWVASITTAVIVSIINPSGISFTGVVKSIFPLVTANY